MPNMQDARSKLSRITSPLIFHWKCTDERNREVKRHRPCVRQCEQFGADPVQLVQGKNQHRSMNARTRKDEICLRAKFHEPLTLLDRLILHICLITCYTTGVESHERV